MRFLFCTDGSEISFQALSKCFELVKPGAIVDVFHVIHQNFLLQKIHPDNNFDKKYQEVLGVILEKTQNIIKEHAHFQGENFIVHGNNNKIIEHVQNCPYELVIAGSHGLKGVRNQIGSTSRKLVQHSISPVFIGKSKPFIERVDDDLSRKKAVLFCVDESFQSLNAIEKFIKLFDSQKFDLDTLTVSQDIMQYPIEIASDSVWIEACLKAEENSAKEILRKTNEIFNHHGLKINQQIHLKGDIADEITQYAQAQKKDLLVLGSHAREGISDFLLGSISKKVLDYCDTSIVILPAK